MNNDWQPFITKTYNKGQSSTDQTLALPYSRYLFQQTVSYTSTKQNNPTLSFITDTNHYFYKTGYRYTSLIKTPATHIKRRLIWSKFWGN